MTKTIPCKYIVRVRETERDAAGERSWEYLSAKDAVKLKRRAEKAGLYSVILRVIDKDAIRKAHDG